MALSLAFSHSRLPFISSPERLTARLGETDLQSKNEQYPHIDRKVKTIIIHPKYQSYGKVKEYDVALLKLKESVEFSAHILPICLPKDDNLLFDKIAWFKGFGHTSYSKILR